MKYLKEEPLLNRLGKQIDMDTPEEKKGLTTGLYIYLVMDTYQPMQGFILNPGEMRLFNKVLSILDGDPKEGCWEFEDADFALLRKVVLGVAPYIPLLSRYTPAIEDKFAEVKDKLELGGS